jgi:D-alanine-D-alanine ligase
MMKKNIALVTGGYSGEAVISYKSAETIQKNIDTDKWNCYLIDIHPSGWFFLSADGDKIAVDKNNFSIKLKILNP